MSPISHMGVYLHTSASTQPLSHLALCVVMSSLAFPVKLLCLKNPSDTKHKTRRTIRDKLGAE